MWLFLAIGEGTQVKIIINEPVVLDKNVNFQAKLYVPYYHQYSETFQYEWIDSASPQHNNVVSFKNIILKCIDNFFENFLLYPDGIQFFYIKLGN